VTADPNNPTISCTERELAWSAWQIGQQRLNLDLSRPDAPIAADGTPDEIVRFSMWWDGVLNAVAAWRDGLAGAGPDPTPTPLTFEAWWKRWNDFADELIANDPTIQRKSTHDQCRDAWDAGVVSVVVGPRPPYANMRELMQAAWDQGRAPAYSFEAWWGNSIWPEPAAQPTPP
jgi:hypothetical protein